MNQEKMKLRLLKLIVLLVDAAIVYGSYLIGMYLKFRQVFTHPVYKELQSIILGIIIIELIAIYVYDLYHDLHKSNEAIVVSVFVTLAISGMITLVYIFLDDYFTYSRFVILYALAIQAILLSVWHIVVHRIVIKVVGLIKVLVIGPAGETTDVAIKLLTKYKNRYEIRYILDATQLEAVETLISDIDILIICSSMTLNQKNQLRAVCSQYEKNLFLIPEVYDISIRHTRWQQLDDIAVLSMTSMGMSLDERFIKRAVDLMISTLVMIVFLPIYIVIAILIRLDSKGPALFKQDRVTKDNQVFGLYKFRTMVVDAEKETGPVLTTTTDERLTRIGGLLRKTRLDELPQMWHVFTGSMSLVGPRPERPHFIEQFKDEIPNFEQRLRVKAGITGLAQVLGKYATNPSNKLRYDLMYINNFSMWLDLKIMIQTIGIIFMGEKAKGLDEVEKLQYIEQINQLIDQTKLKLK